VPDLIPLAKAASEFGVNQATIYRYLKAGELKRYKRAMDRKTYIDRLELRRLIKPRVVKG
jgi:predicted site-specific integrase-resolvase